MGKKGMAFCIENSKCVKDFVGACPSRNGHVGKASGLPDCNKRPRTGRREAKRYKAKNCESCRKEGHAWCTGSKICVDDKVGACPSRNSHVGKASGLPDCN